eukprot:5511236-Heterocapsa_arctica.AAC.1
MCSSTRTLLEQAGMPTSFWPKAADAFCDHINFAIVDGDSAWNKRHKDVHFTGMQVPFEALSEFRPPKPIMEKLPKFAGTSIPGIFKGVLHVVWGVMEQGLSSSTSGGFQGWSC